MATATRALAVLRDEGLVVSRSGSGTFVSSPAPRPRTARTARTARTDNGLTTGRIVATGLSVADSDGLQAVSMRRLAAELEVSPMTLYRHLAGREELEHLLARAVFRACPLPDPGPPGWRAKLELVCRTQWRAYRRHPWLPELMSSLTRPLLLPEAMAHTEWTLAALSTLDLTPIERTREALSLASLVRGLAASAAAETHAEHETGQANHQWWIALDDELCGLMASGRYPNLAAVPDAAIEDLDALLEHALARHLDGLATLPQLVPRV